MRARVRIKPKPNPKATARAKAEVKAKAELINWILFPSRALPAVQARTSLVEDIRSKCAKASD